MTSSLNVGNIYNTPQQPVVVDTVPKNVRRMSFKAGENDQFVRQQRVSQPPMMDSYARMIAEQKKQEKAQKRKQNLSWGIGIASGIAIIAMAVLSIRQGRAAQMGQSGQNGHITEEALQHIWEDLKIADSLDDLALPESLKKLLDKVKTNSMNIDTVKKRGGKPIKSILLYGPPGTGKTTFAKALAKSYPDAKFASLDVTGLGSEYVSVTEKNLNAAVDMICKEARENPKKKFFVFIDEIDSVMMVDDGKGAKHSNNILNEFKKCFTEKLAKEDNIITVGATNLEIDIEKATAAGGKKLDKPMLDRFAQKILVDLPTGEQIQNAVSKHYKGCELAEEVLKNKDLLKDFGENLHKGRDVSFRTLDYLYGDAAALLHDDVSKVTMKELSQAVVDKNNELHLPEEALNWFKKQAGII